MSTNDLDADDLPRGDDRVTVGTDDATQSELAARIERLREENRRLRDDRARRSRHRRLGLALALVGTAFGVGALAVPDSRVVLFSVAATGLFGGILAYTLSDGRFVDAAVADRIYGSAATNGDALVDAFDLRDERVYVPYGDGARLFVPRRSEYAIPDGLEAPVRADGGRSDGVVLEPTGAGLVRAVGRRRDEGLPSVPSDLGAALADALVERFELVSRAESAVDLGDGGGRVTVAVAGSALGDVDRFDHPVASFLAAGLAAGLERPIELEVAPGTDRDEWIVRCRWAESEGGLRP